MHALFIYFHFKNRKVKIEKKFYLEHLLSTTFFLTSSSTSSHVYKYIFIYKNNIIIKHINIYVFVYCLLNIKISLILPRNITSKRISKLNLYCVYWEDSFCSIYIY
jgi:hypothetical protein